MSTKTQAQMIEERNQIIKHNKGLPNFDKKKDSKKEAKQIANKAAKQEKNKQKNKQKGNKMSYTPVTYGSYVKKVSKIQTYKDFNNVGVIMMDDEVMQKIKKQSGPLADSCEYQVHYWALIIRAIAADKSILDICIPTTFFNYKQEVSGARIDFELSDVDEVSNKLLPIHNMKINELLASGSIDAIKTMFESEGCEVQLLSTNLNSIHKHPGGINQNFSGTDLDSDHEHNTGIVFPLAEGSMKPNFAGIMAHVASSNKIAHYEYRIADGKVGPLPTDEIKYYRGRCIAIVRAKNTPAVAPIAPSAISSMFGIPTIPGVPEKSNTYFALNELDKAVTESNTVLNLKHIWESSIFVPFTDAVIPDNIARKVYTPAATTSYGSVYGAHGIQHSLYGYDFDNADMAFYNSRAKLNLNNGTKMANTDIQTPTNNKPGIATSGSLSGRSTNLPRSEFKPRTSYKDPFLYKELEELEFKSAANLESMTKDEIEFECRSIDYLTYDIEFQDESIYIESTPKDMLITRYNVAVRTIQSKMDDIFVMYDDDAIEVNDKTILRSELIAALNPIYDNIEYSSYDELKHLYIEEFLTVADVNDEQDTDEK